MRAERKIVLEYLEKMNEEERDFGFTAYSVRIAKYINVLNKFNKELEQDLKAATSVKTNDPRYEAAIAQSARYLSAATDALRGLNKTIKKL